MANHVMHAVDIMDRGFDGETTTTTTTTNITVNSKYDDRKVVPTPMTADCSNRRQSPHGYHHDHIRSCRSHVLHGDQTDQESPSPPPLVTRTLPSYQNVGRYHHHHNPHPHSDHRIRTSSSSVNSPSPLSRGGRCPNIVLATVLSCGMGGFNCSDGGATPLCYVRCCRVDCPPDTVVPWCCCCTCCWCCCLWPHWSYWVHKQLDVDYWRGQSVKDCPKE